MKYCVSKKCCEYVNTKGGITWRAKTAKNVSEDKTHCPDCGDKFFEYRRKRVIKGYEVKSHF